MRRVKLGYVVLALVAVALAAPAAGTTRAGANEGKLTMIAWEGYLDAKWVKPFEKQSGCKVQAKYAGSSDEMVTLMNQGGFDLVTASGDASLRLVAGKKVQPVNVDLIPSWKTVDDRLKDAPWHTVDGVHYGVPFQWGPNVLAYSTEVFKKTPTSWSVVE